MYNAAFHARHAVWTKSLVRSGGKQAIHGVNLARGNQGNKVAYQLYID
jgi:hypothetical protein